MRDWEYRKEMASQFRRSLEAIDRAAALGTITFPEDLGQDFEEAQTVLNIITDHLENAKEILDALGECKDAK